MSIHEPISRGDWIRATAKNGSVIEGQAGSDSHIGGLAYLPIVLCGDGSDTSIEVVINVNSWDVQITRKNLMKKED